MKKMSEVVERLRKRMEDPKYIAKMEKKRIRYKKSLTAEWQFGFFVGEDIVNTCLPTLNTECTTRNVINVSEEETLERDRLAKLWSDKYNYKDDDSAKEEWKNLRDYEEMLKFKYLPDPLIYYCRLLNIRNEKNFKDGLISSLWDSDRCNYDLSPDKIKIYEDGDYFTIIEFELSDKKNKKVDKYIL